MRAIFVIVSLNLEIGDIYQFLHASFQLILNEYVFPGDSRSPDWDKS